MARCLYIHIPFCARKCLYCDFLSVPFDRPLSERYVAALAEEIRLRAEEGEPLETLYIGGGTPTVLEAGQLARVFEALRESFDFQPGAEVTVEANPGTVDAGKVDSLLSLGVNRISLGVQSFSDRELRALGRTHTASDAEKALGLLRGRNFSVDLIYGIPGQDLKTWGESVSRAMEAGPAHVSAYELTPERGTPLYAALESKEVSLPSEDAAVEMFLLARERLEAAGYGHYEISNYALTGRQCRHNLNYWRRGRYLGLGAGAHSFDGKRRTKNTGDLAAYIDALSRGRPPVEETAVLGAEDALKELVFLGLRETRGIRAEGPAGALLAGAASELMEEGLMESEGGRLRLTLKGMLLSNSVFVRLFERIEAALPHRP
jgi:oxygen-independent coproporphyrinogen-3 oxidase